MLFLNWDLDFNYPKVVYQSIVSTNKRKLKFFYLAHLTCDLIHFYCLKMYLYEYIQQLFYIRLQKYYINTNINKQTIRNKLNYYYKSLKIDKLKSNNIKNNWLINIYLLKYVIWNYYLKKIIILLKKDYYLLSASMIKFINIKLSKSIYSFYKLYKTCRSFKNIVIKSSNGLEDLQNVSKLSRFIKIFSLFNFYKSFFFNNIIDKTNRSTKKSTINIPNISNYKKIDYNSFLYLQNYLWFYSKKQKHIYKIIDYISFVNLTSFKNLLLKIRNKYLDFRRIIQKIVVKNKKTFYKFFNNYFNSNQSMVGFVNKKKLFKYIARLSNNIRQSFVKHTFLNKHISKQKPISFFYNSSKIRRDLMLFLGKRRYISDWLKKDNYYITFKYYIKYYYSLSRTQLYYYYHKLKHKFRVKYIKDLFFFLEYKMSFFFNKYISYNIYTFKKQNISLNNISNTNMNNTYLYIGDYLKLDKNDSLYNYYSDIFYIFFNFIFFINPIILKNKSNILKQLYTHTHLFSYNKLFNNKSYIKQPVYLSSNILNSLKTLVTCASTFGDTVSQGTVRTNYKKYNKKDIIKLLVATNKGNVIKNEVLSNKLPGIITYPYISLLPFKRKMSNKHTKYKRIFSKKAHYFKRFKYKKKVLGLIRYQKNIRRISKTKYLKKRFTKKALNNNASSYFLL